MKQDLSAAWSWTKKSLKTPALWTEFFECVHKGMLHVCADIEVKVIITLIYVTLRRNHMRRNNTSDDFMFHSKASFAVFKLS